MSISNEIQKLQTNLTNSYEACSDKGATMPASQNFDNLADCIDSITSGSGVDKYLVSNVTKVGALVENKGIIGNFTPNNKALTTYNPNEIVTTPFEVSIKFKTGSNITTFQGIYGQSVTNKYCPQMQLIRDSSSTTTRFSQILSPEGSTWGAELKYSPVLANTDYILKTVFDGSKAYLYVSENGSPLELVSTIDQSAVFWKEPICLGQDNGDAFYGTIDLNECYIKRGGETVWTGMTTQN